MHNPPHPGEILKEMYLDALGLTITQTAEALDITRQALSELANGKTRLTIDMAMRLAKAFKTTPQMWVNLQSEYDLWQIKDKSFRTVHCLVDERKRAA
jgi:addiction module HigA family antidote